MDSNYQKIRAIIGGRVVKGSNMNVVLVDIKTTFRLVYDPNYRQLAAGSIMFGLVLETPLTFHDETLLYPGFDDPHEGRCERKVLREYQMQQYVWNVKLAEIAGQLTLRINLMQADVPFE